MLTRSITFAPADFQNRPYIDDVDVTVAFAKSNDDFFVPQSSPITSGTPFFNEIEFTLSSPAGASVKLISNDGSFFSSTRSFNVGTSAGFQGTITFDQDAGTRVNANRDVINSGTFRSADPPAESLDAFRGESAVGTWTLSVGDDVGLDGLSFYSYSLAVNTLPEPGAIGLWGTLGLVSLLVLTRRKRRTPTPSPAPT